MNSKDKYTEKQISWVGKKSEFRSRHIFRVVFSGIWLTDLRPDLENLAKLSLASSCASMWLVFVTYPWWWGAVGRTPDLGAEVLGPHPFLPFSFPRGLAWSLTLLEPASHNLWNEMTKAHIHYQVSQNRSRDTLKIVRYCRTMWGEVRWGGVRCSAGRMCCRELSSHSHMVLSLVLASYAVSTSPVKLLPATNRFCSQSELLRRYSYAFCFICSR